ncbi:MAG: type II secretion system inner membrane protein GspF [Gammaproteobacteria bacterium]|nr:type II secretion system inner membrane protein GspF [Gammaproteobacteria bacterium]
MSVFEYKALDANGKETKGVLEADNSRQVRQILRDKGWMALSVDETRQTEEKKRKQIALFNSVSATDLSLLTRQLSTLVRSGIPVEEALQAVSQQTEKPRLKSMVMGVRSRVLEGHSLATALADYPHVFNELFRSTVEAGEQSGHINTVLDRLADYTEGRQQLQQKMMMALLYPILISIVAVVVVVLLLAYVVPQVVEMFDHIGQELPMLTIGMIATSDFITQYGIYVAALLVMMFVGFQYMLKNEGFKREYHKFLLKIPLISKLVRGLNTARFARTFSILAASGVPILDAMRISSQVLVNLPMRDAVAEASDRVREGAGISKSLAASGYFPPMTIHLIASGETSGNLEEMLERSADSQEREMEALLGTIMGLFEPLMILFMGATVLVIVLAIMMPILDMNQLVK